MGNICDCFDYPMTLETRDTRALKSYGDRWLSNLPTLKRGQLMTTTKRGQRIQRCTTTIVWTDYEVGVLQRDPNATQQMRLISSTPFRDIDRILDHLFLTGLAGVTRDNLVAHNISVIINATFEVPLLMLPGRIYSVRVPVDDDPEDEIYPYLHDITDFMFRAAYEGFRIVVHCLAGASRSTTIVLAYLIKYGKLTLEEAFDYVHRGRPCARPNMAFFSQLIRFEKDVYGTATVKMREYPVRVGGGSGRVIRVPDLYKRSYPQLFEAEKNNQLRN
ncbi:Dual specificity protein phosphatase 14 [Tyrophagus putrescentiae]|nr:Dual specificity protein phosphatase 14 [Tyrophagus putrescentiae]